MAPKLPDLLKKTVDKAMLSSQSVDNFSCDTPLPRLNVASKRFKRMSKDDMVALKRSKRKSQDHSPSPAPPSQLGAVEFVTHEQGHAGEGDEGGEGMRSAKKNRVKTNKVTINPRKLNRGMSSAMYTECDENPLRKFLTKNMRDPESPAAVADVKTFWLYAVALVSRTAFLNCLTNSPCAFASPLAISLAQRRLAANLRLVMYIKQRCLWFRTKIKVKTDFVRNHGWKLVLFWRCVQRRKAVVLLRRMLTDFESFRLPYVMLRYRVNAVHLQRYIRSFLEVTESRKRVLLMKWHKVASHMKANLIPFLFDQKVREDEARSRRDRDKWQGVEIDPDVLPSLGARVNLITKRTAALQMQLHASEAKIQKHRMELFAQRNKKKKRAMFPARLPAIERGDDDDEGDSPPAPSPGSLQKGHEQEKQMKQQRAQARARGGGDRELADDSRNILQIISGFVYECRRTCKVMEQHKVIVRAKKKQEGMTCEEARRILTNPYAAMTFAEDISSNEVQLDRMHLTLFTGQQDEAFRLLVENYLRAENGLDPQEYCSEYDGNYQSRAAKK